MSLGENRLKSFDDLKVGDLIRIVNTLGGRTPRQMNNCHAIVGEDYYIVRLSRNGAVVSETPGGRPIYCGRVMVKNIAFATQPKLYIHYKKDGVKAKRMEYERKE